MTSVASFLSMIWNMYCSVQIPTMGITAGQLFLAIIVIQLSLLVLKKMLGLASGGIGSMRREDNKLAEIESRKEHRK